MWFPWLQVIHSMLIQNILWEARKYYSNISTCNIALIHFSSALSGRIYIDVVVTAGQRGLKYIMNFDPNYFAWLTGISRSLASPVFSSR